MIQGEEAKHKVVTFGCRLNTYESETIKKLVSNSKQDKDLIIFNSCAVTKEAERQLKQSVRKHKRQNPEAKIIVTGCGAQINPCDYAKMPEVDLVLGNNDKFDLKNYQNDKSIYEKPKISASKQIDNEISHKDRNFFNTKSTSYDFINSSDLAKIRVNDIMSVRDNAPQLISYFENKTRAFIEIQNGCNHRCTFCVIPYGRGNSRSVPLGEIVSMIKKLVINNHNEIVLTGVDISDYGKDLDYPITLSQMIKRVLKQVPQLARLRLSSIDVAELDDDFFNLLKNEPRLMPYLHLSVQSGDDMILKRMKRRHNYQQVIDFCHKARSIRPDITFGADIIAGFPTEDKNAFNNSLKLIKEADLIFTHIFPYSKREGTPAALMPQIDKKTIKLRAKLLRQAGEEQLKKYLATQIGKDTNIIIEKNNIAKSDNFLDIEVDNLVSNKISQSILPVIIKHADYEKLRLVATIKD
ncbi:MAG: tRNA (N(6)-L-threonylcarbamoyladenosine(37)-C(2))-methylthiotransferase MtaB [Rickettsiales bacterium]|nr:tRNA (N(6)-L-threonylcarbamoyladenosine(37)-C(2))-methylthiotransferase MtaB [Rickettsiales bacterium]|tara:strand:+ start:7430 stop:8830 length:1401 start_codon:yes stop_codon:yes gene_type:complete